MRLILALLLFTSTLSAQTDFFSFDDALAQAKNENKSVLLLFSGSDWCKPCIQLKKDIISSEEFQNYAKDNIVLLNLDFPYKKKNRLPKTHKKHNERLAEQFNKKGEFPKVIIVSDKGEYVREIEYNKGLSVSQFIDKINNL